MTLTTVPPATMIDALSDLRAAHLLLLANHGELTNLAAAQVRDALDVNFDGGDPFDTRSRTAACQARFLQAQACLRDALAKLGVRERAELQTLMLPSVVLDCLDGMFDVVVAAPQSDAQKPGGRRERRKRWRVGPRPSGANEARLGSNEWRSREVQAWRRAKGGRRHRLADGYANSVQGRKTARPSELTYPPNYEFQPERKR